MERIICVVLLLGISSSLIASLKNDRMEMIFRQSDRLITAQVWDGKPIKKVDNESTYHWCDNLNIYKTQSGFSGRLLDGTYMEHYLNGALAQEGNFKKGLKKGEWKSWRNDGTLEAIYEYRNGKENGVYRLYDVTGSLIETGKYRKGLLDGQVKTYVDGQLVRTEKYDRGQLILDQEEPDGDNVAKDRKQRNWKFWKKNAN